MNTADAVARKALEKKFKIHRKIGQGGYAVVYLAEEPTTGGLVAVKVLLHAGASPTVVERFKSEIRIASRLVHPHIIPLYYAGDTENLPYYVMPYIDGASLRDNLAPGRLFPIDRAVAIAIEIADALHYAHAVGVVHRDIKPENLLMAGDHVWVADFGIAKALSAIGLTRSTSGITDPNGGVPGTAPYMSPEQVLGDGELDGRSDVHSLGSVLYEMLAGRTPWHRELAHAEMVARFVEPPPSLRAIRGEVPPELEDAVMCALAKEPNDRFATAGEFRDALAKPGTGRRAPVSDDMSSIVVLPFTMRSRGEEEEIFAEAMTDQMIAALVRLRRLKVVARESTFALKGRPLNAQEIGRLLHVRIVLSGNMLREGSRLRIFVSLASTSDGFLIWADDFDCAMGDMTAVQDQIARRIVDSVYPGRPAPDARTRTPVEDEVNRLVMFGRHFLRPDPDSLEKAREFFERALAVNPDSAQAHAELGYLFAVLGIYGFVSPRESAPRARAESLRAIELDPSKAEPHAALATVQSVFDWDWEDARLSFQRALAINPQYSLGYVWYANYVLIPLGEMRVAIEELEKARAFDPLWCMIDATIGIAHYFLRDFAKAEKHLKDALQLDQDHMITQFFLGKVLVELRRTPQAIAVLQQTYERSGKNPMPLAEIAYAHARAGDHAAARATLEALRALRDGTRFVSSGLEGIVCAALGESDEAIRLFERAVEERATDLQWLGVHPGLDAIRAHPRFLALLRGIRLRPAST